MRLQQGQREAGDPEIPAGDDQTQFDQTQPDQTQPDQAQRSEHSDPPVVNDHLVRDVFLYTVARLAMVAVLAGVLMGFGVPLLVAMAVAVVVGMPLSLVTLRGLRRKVAAGIAARTAKGRARREELRAQLRGEREESADFEQVSG